jgi:hypothetical protein
MDKYDKKQFIKDIMNFKSTTDSQVHQDFHDGVVADVNKELMGIPGLKNIGEMDIDNYIASCEEHDIDPMDNIAYAFELISSVGKISLQGREVDLSLAPEILEKLKQKFIKHKEANDIKNF